MRGPMAAFVAVLILGFSSAAFALTAEDSMAAWVQASEAERSALLDMLEADLPKDHVGRSALVACMNRAAEIGGHGALLIGEVAQACAMPPPPGDDQDRTAI